MLALLSVRVPRVAVCLFALLLGWLCASPPALAQQVAPLARDGSFGGGGFAAIPTLTPGAPAPLPLGFVRLPLSPGYVVFSMQQVNGVFRIVASRYTDDGVLFAPWGNSGSQTYSLPIPLGGPGGFGEEVQARVTVNQEGAAEILYLVLLYKDNLNVTNLMVARIGTDGGLLSVANSTLSNGLTRGIGAITAIATANAGPLYSNNPGLLLAVQGRESELDTTELIQVSTPLNGTVTTIFEYPTGDGRITRADLRIRHLSLRDDGKFDLAGTQGGKAMYMLYDAHTFRVLRENYFTLSCGSSVASVADNLVRDTSLGGAVLLVGRADCGAGTLRPVLAKVLDIDTFPSLAWTVTTAEAINGCSDLRGPCLASYATVSSPGRAHVVTPPGYLALVNVAGSGTILGRDSLFDTGQNLSVLPSLKMGAARNTSYLTGVAVAVTPDGTSFGLGRVALDRLFGYGMDIWQPPAGE